MQFERIKIVGFKSFADPVDIPIYQGLTGIIGPNGCGKSNLVEALRWCMGESSSKAMRAGEMDDVIFAGSSARPSRNFAEVTLVLNNESRSAPAIFNADAMIQVRRKLMREAGSHYKVNLKDARARDVQLLFADAATGARSPSMVRQGQISELIMAKPQARRRILEDAAGISGLAARRHEAELRLNAAIQNLEKLQQTLVELESQQQKLQKQAREAIKFCKIEAEIVVSEYKICHVKFRKASENAQTLSAELNNAQQAYETAQNEMLAFETNTTKRAQIIENAKEKLDLLSKELQEKTAAQKLLHIEIARFTERKSGIAHQIHTISADLEREQNLCAEATAQVDGLNAELAKLNSLLPQDTSRVQEALFYSTQAEDARLNADKHRTAIAQEAANAQAHAKMNSDMVSEAQQNLAQLQSKLDAAKLAIAALPSTEQYAAEIEKLNTQKTEIIAEIQEVNKNITAQENALDALNMNVEKAQSEYSQLYNQAQGAQLEIKTLTNIINASKTDSHPKISDTIIIQKGYEAAVAAALKHELMMSENDTSNAHIVPTQPQKLDAKLPANALPLSRFVSGLNVLARALPMIGVVENLADFSAHDLAAGQILVTKTGALLRWDGVHILSDFSLSETHILVQKNRLIELNTQLPQLDAHCNDAKETLANARSQQQTRIAAIKTLKEQLGAHQKTLVHVENSLATTLAQLNKVELGNSGTLAQYKSLVQQVLDAEDFLAQKQNNAINSTAPKIDEKAVIEAQLALQTAHANAIQARLQYEELLRETDKRAGRIHHIEKDIAAWQRRRDEAEWAVNRLKTRTEDLRKDAKQFEITSVDGMERRDSELIREIAATQSALIEQKQILENLERAAKDEITLQKHAAHNLQELRDAVTRLEVQAHTAQEAFTAAQSQLEQFKTYNAQTELLEEHPQNAIDIAQLEAQLERLIRVKDSIGEVNLIAEAELNETVERYNALVQDQNDVASAVAQFRESIAKLNFEGRVRLQKAFDAIHVHFTRLFQTLFEGGEAELIRTGGEDPLEWGLDIIANPPGKKPQNLSLLSGGEQALTAMALIFAVFLSNPSPICVLDEVDAPLDDANVERFCRLLDEMKRQTSTRFLIITHNPITMSHMDQLYGVTMPERGVSQIVSVQLREAIELVEAA